MVTVADFGCGNDYVGAGKTGYCNADTTTSYEGTRSANMVAFQKSGLMTKTNYWISNSHTACYRYVVGLGSGIVGTNVHSDRRVGD